MNGSEMEIVVMGVVGDAEGAFISVVMAGYGLFG